MPTAAAKPCAYLLPAILKAIRCISAGIKNGDVVLSAKPADWQGFNAAAREWTGENIEGARGRQEHDVFADWRDKRDAPQYVGYS